MKKIILALSLLLSSPAFAGTLIVINPATKTEIKLEFSPDNFAAVEAANLRYSHALIHGFLTYKRENGQETRTPGFDLNAVTVLRTPEDGRPFTSAKLWAQSLK